MFLSFLKKTKYCICEVADCYEDDTEDDNDDKAYNDYVIIIISFYLYLYIIVTT